MSDDIVTRLRERAVVLFCNGADGNAFIDEQAADEIERLREENHELRSNLLKHHKYIDTRSNDSDTSKEGAKEVSVRRDTQQGILLEVYSRPEYRKDGLTDEEAGVVSGLADNPRCCYWKRCSELREMGLLEDTGLTRESSANAPQRAFRISTFGLKFVREFL